MKKNILVVDDDPEIVGTLRDYLAQAGYGVLTAYSGRNALQRIRSEPSLKDIRVIIVSGVVNRDDVQTLVDCGADDFLQKPFNIEHLVNRITELTT